MRLRAREIAAEGRYEEKHTQPPEAHVSPLCEAKIGLCGFRVFPTEVAFRVVARIRSWILRHHGVIRPPIMASFHTAHRSGRVQLRTDFRSTSSSFDRPNRSVSTSNPRFR